MDGTSTGSVSYTFDANGNLLNDGVNTYTYDSANRLVAVSREQGVESNYAYSGLGDRLQQTTAGGVTTNYTLDLNTGLTQVLSDGTNTYTYGLGRISQTNTSTEYFLGDALGSVRQLTNANAEVTLAKSYDPYGNVIQSAGSGSSVYGFTGETTDVNGLVYLRARYYNPLDGRFQSRDTWDGNVNSPMSLNRWNYVEGNPINYIDPTGLISEKNSDEAYRILNDLSTYNVFIKVDWGEYYYRDPTDSGFRCGWHEGGWIMKDLKAIQDGVHIMVKGVSFLGGNFKSLIGGVVYLPDKGGPDGKGNKKDDPAGTVPGVTTWRVPNWYGEAFRLLTVVHEMGHIVAFNDKPQMINYYMGELGASCSNQASYCNINKQPTDPQKPRITYDPGELAGEPGDMYKYMPSKYARVGSYEDFAETWREVVTRAYIRSGDATYIRQARLVYNFNYAPYTLNHDIGRRRKVMNSIINGSWK